MGISELLAGPTQVTSLLRENVPRKTLKDGSRSISNDHFPPAYLLHNSSTGILTPRLKHLWVLGGSMRNMATRRHFLCSDGYRRPTCASAPRPRHLRSTNRAPFGLSPSPLSGIRFEETDGQNNSSLTDLLIVDALLRFTFEPHSGNLWTITKKTSCRDSDGNSMELTVDLTIRSLFTKYGGRSDISEH